jgi:hypothetical protein
VRTLLAWVLILHTLHLPIPFPDLDGECRGVPILSLSNSNAWHVLLIGVRPNDDIDRGPIRTSHQPNGRAPGETPFGDPVAVTVATFEPGAEVVSVWHFLLPDTQSSDRTADECCHQRRLAFGGATATRSSRVVCVSFCSWQV